MLEHGSSSEQAFPSPSSSSSTAIPASQRLLKEGSGWRLGWDPSRPHYQALIGGSNWAFELTAVEFEEFCHLLHQLSETMLSMAAELMDEERICCEAETERVWLEVEGFPASYGLRIILTEQRGAEGAWSAEAVPELLRAAQSLKAF